MERPVDDGAGGPINTDLKNVRRVIIRSDGSFNSDPNGDWVSARHFDEALAEIARLQQLLRVADDVGNKAASALRRSGEPS